MTTILSILNTLHHPQSGRYGHVLFASRQYQILFFLIAFMGSLNLHGQDATVKSNFDNWSFGLNINQFQKDFGIGLQMTTPYFGKKINASFRGAYNFQYLEHLNAGNNITWTSYRNAQLGIRFASNVVNDFFRYYGEAGGILIFPNEDFSSASSEPGLYGLFGFEFLFGQMKGTPRGYFIELGGVGTGAKADKVVHNPIYSNGFLIGVGLRFYHRWR